MAGRNRQITLAARPEGWPKLSDFQLVETDLPQPQEGEVLVRTLYLSVDPYMRGRMNARKSYAAPVELGDVMVGEIVGRVETSRSNDFQPGDVVAGMLGWQEFAAATAKKLRKIDSTVAPLSTALGVLGMPGMTAYFGLLEIGQPKAGETVVVSGAAGAVGSTVGQIAKIKGCRAVGVVGSDEKLAYITEELGFDAGFNYKTTGDYLAKLKELCPDGIDVYFDNVGGPITDAVFPLINTRARVVVCGQIALYNEPGAQDGPRFLWKLIEKQARIEGFLVFQFADRIKDALTDLAARVADGRLKYREHVVEGIEHAPDAFLGLFRGENIGKQLVKVSD